MDFNDSPDGVSARPTPAADSGLNREWFQNPNPGAGIQGTTLGADFLNDLWGSMKNILLAAGYTPERGNDVQIRGAIQILAAQLVNSHAIQISNEAIAGHLETGAPGEVRGLSSAARALTPSNLPNAWRHGEQAGSTDAWDADPADFMGRWTQHPTHPIPGAGSHLVVTEQWGVTAEFVQNAAITFPIPFAATNYSFTHSALSANFSNARFHTQSAAGLSVSISNFTGRVMWRAVGLAVLQP